MAFPPPAPGSPPSPAYGPPPPSSSRKWLILGLAAGAVVVVLLLAVVAVVVYRATSSGPDTTGPVTLREPVRFQQVAQTQPPPCPAGMLAEVDGGDCFRLQPGGFTVHRMEDIRLVPPQEDQGRTQWSVEFVLTPSDARAFAQLTEAAHREPPVSPRNRIAIVLGQAVLSAPTVAAPITGGRVQIDGPGGQESAQRLFQQLTGRQAP